MNISFSELRQIKHSLPTGSINKIAEELKISEQTVRNFFGAKKFEEGEIAGIHVQPGPDGGFVNIQNTDILELAQRLIKESADN